MPASPEAEFQVRSSAMTLGAIVLYVGLVGLAWTLAAIWDSHLGLAAAAAALLAATFTAVRRLDVGAAAVLFVITAVPLAAFGWFGAEDRALFATAWFFYAGGSVVVLSIQILGGGKESDRLIGIAQRSIEALRESEARYRRLTESAMEGICIHRDGAVLEANGAFTRLFGLKADEVVGTRIEDLVDPASLPLVFDHMKRDVEEIYEVVGVRRDGTRFAAEVAARSVPYQGGSARVTAIRDITQSRRAEEADRQAFQAAERARQLEDVARFRKDILNTASHEIATPLTPMRLQLDLLRNGMRGRLTEIQTKSIEIISRNMDRVQRLVLDVLDMGRIESGGLRLDRDWIDPYVVAEGAYASFVDVARAKGVQLTMACPDVGEIYADQRRLGQVFDNLLSNAVKFTPSGGRVGMRSWPAEDGVHFVVEDTGIGIAPERLGQLLKPFAQAHDEPARFGGTGLGLCVVKGIVEAHGGRFLLTSAGLGKGSAATLWLPTSGPDSTEGEPAKGPSPVTSVLRASTLPR